MRILGIETSCDETAIGIVEDGQRVCANVIASSQQHHALYGGVVPEIAARVHVEVIWDVLDEALRDAKMELSAIDAVAVTQGPGLPGALLVGTSFAKGLALALDRPLIGIHHLAAHLYAGHLADPTLEPPYLGLIVSGGHTLLCVAHPDQRFEVLGETQDDAVGEAFDKVGKLLGLGYPGGPAIDRIAPEGNRAAIAFPRAMPREGLDFSFSGLKTAVYQYVTKLKGQADRRQIADIAASFQEAAIDILVSKTLKAAHRTGIKRLVVGGGVAANSRLRERLLAEAEAKRLQVTLPELSLCMDNGAMVAGLGVVLLRQGQVAPWSMAIDPGLRLRS